MKFGQEPLEGEKGGHYLNVAHLVRHNLQGDTDVES